MFNEIKNLFWILLFSLPALHAIAGSSGGSCRELFNITTDRTSLNSILIDEINQFSQKRGPITKFSQVLQISNKVLKRLELNKRNNVEQIYVPTSLETFLLKNIEIYFIRNGVKQILNSTSTSISTPHLWQKMQEFKESNGNSTFHSILSIITLEPVYKSIIIHSLKMADNYIVPFISKEKPVPFQYLNLGKVPTELLHSIVMNGVNKQKIQSLYELFGNGISAEYRATVALKYMAKLIWIIIFIAILDDLHDLLKQNQVYSYLKDLYSIGQAGLIEEMINMDKMIGLDAEESFYLDLNPYEFLKEYQEHYSH